MIRAFICNSGTISFIWGLLICIHIQKTEYGHPVQPMQVAHRLGQLELSFVKMNEFNPNHCNTLCNHRAKCCVCLFSTSHGIFSAGSRPVIISGKYLICIWLRCLWIFFWVPMWIIIELDLMTIGCSCWWSRSNTWVNLLEFVHHVAINDQMIMWHALLMFKIWHKRNVWGSHLNNMVGQLCHQCTWHASIQIHNHSKPYSNCVSWSASCHHLMCRPCSCYQCLCVEWSSWPWVCCMHLLQLPRIFRKRNNLCCSCRAILMAYCCYSLVTILDVHGAKTIVVIVHGQRAGRRHGQSPWFIVRGRTYLRFFRVMPLIDNMVFRINIFCVYPLIFETNTVQY